MKKLHLLVFLGFISAYTTAQKWTIPTDIVKMYIADNKLSEVDNLDLMIAVDTTDDGFYKFTVSYSDSIPQKFQLKPLDPESFIIKTKFAIEKAFGDIGKSLTAADIVRVNNYLTTLYTNIAIYLRTDEEKPQVATIYLRDTLINTYFGKKKEEKIIIANSLHISKVNLTFFGGFIEKVQVLGNIELKDKKTIPIEFNNKFSIGISSTEM